MTPRTAYTETEALLIAQEDVEADSGNSEETDAYLRENFTAGELQRLAWTAEHLAERCRAIRREVRPK